MDMTNKEIIDAMSRLEMSGGMNLIPVKICDAIVNALKPAATNKAAPKVKGKQPE